VDSVLSDAVRLGGGTWLSLASEPCSWRIRGAAVSTPHLPLSSLSMGGCVWVSAGLARPVLACRASEPEPPGRQAAWLAGAGWLAWMGVFIDPCLTF